MILVSDIKEEHKGITCVYKLFHVSEVVYVGQTINLEKRILAHKSTEKIFTHYECIPCKPSEMSDLEAKLIVKYQPKYNWTIPGTCLFISKAAAVKKMTSMCSELIDLLPVAYTAVSNQDYKEEFRRETNYFYASMLNELIDKVVTDASAISEMKTQEQAGD